MADRWTPEASARLSQTLDEPAWLAERRAEAYERFEALPWPDQSHEHWRHTDIRGLDLDQFDSEVATPWGSSVPGQDGVRSAPLHEMARSDEELVRAWLGRSGVPESDEKFHALTAAFGIGMFVHVRPGVEVAEPIVTRYRSASGAALLPRTIIVAGADSELTYIHHYTTGEAGAALAVPVVEIYVEPGARVNYLSVQDWPQKVWHFGLQRAVVERDATLRSLVASVGGKLTRSVAHAILQGRGAHAELLGVYFGDHDQHIDNRTLQAHVGPDTSTELYYKGALKGSSRAVYSGLVDIEKDAKRADAQQANRNLLLSPGASAEPSPFLEIKTSEVARATHGVSVGRPDEEVLFYLRSRGIADDEAQNLYVKGFFQEVIDRVRVPEIRQLLEQAIEDELALED